MRKAFAVTMVLALTALGLAAATPDERRAFTLGVGPNLVAAELQPGGSVCQGPIEVPQGGAFSSVRTQLRTDQGPAPPLEVTVRRPEGPVLGSGILTSGKSDVDVPAHQAARVGKVGVGQQIEVCLRNAGDRRVALYGDAPSDAPSEARDARGRVLPADLELDFVRDQPRSQLSLLGLMVDRAGLFAADWVGAWTLWLVIGLVVVAAPLGLWRALGAAERS